MIEPASRTNSFNSLERYAIWLLGNLSAAALVAWIAFLMQQEGFAPAVLFPLLIGTALGGLGIAVWRLARVPARWVIAGAIVWGLLVVVGQDYIGHRHRLRQYEEALDRHSPLAAMAAEQADMRPRFWQYWLGVVRGDPLWWTLELVLTCAAAASVTALGTRHGAAGDTNPSAGDP